jgi:hypothetical protein
VFCRIIPRTVWFKNTSGFDSQAMQMFPYAGSSTNLETHLSCYSKYLHAISPAHMTRRYIIFA